MTETDWTEPSLKTVDGGVVMHLGSVTVPEGASAARCERVLAVVAELVEQMVEEDILPVLEAEDDLLDYSLVDDDDRPEGFLSPADLERDQDPFFSEM